MNCLQCFEVFIRALSLLFIDTVCAKRTSWIFSLRDSLMSRLTFRGVSYTNGISDEMTSGLIAMACIVLLLAAVLPSRHARTLILICLPFVLAFTICLICIRRLNEMIGNYQPWVLMNEGLPVIFLYSLPIPVLGGLINLMCFFLLPISVRLPDSEHPHGFFSSPMLRGIFCGFIGAFITFLPMILLCLAQGLINEAHLDMMFRFNQHRTSPAVCGYVGIMVQNPFVPLPEPVWQKYAECLRHTHVALQFKNSGFAYFPELFMGAFSCAIILSFFVGHLQCRFVGAWVQLLELISNDPLEFITDYWNRLDMQSILLVFWLTKLTAVGVMGASGWPVDANVIVLASRTPNSDGTPMMHSLNFSFVSAYADEFRQQISVENIYSRFLSRLLTGFLAIGAETWLSVFGAAMFVGMLASVLVGIMSFLVDPLGVNIAQLIQTAEAEPVAANAWTPIEDQLANNVHIEVNTVELLTNIGWSCPVLFVFLAIQYDLPNLRLHQRVFCFIHLLIVMGFTCVYPVESFVKAILLRLDLPGQESSLLDHIIPLMFCIFMLGLSGCVFIYFPAWLSYLPSTGRGYQLFGWRSEPGGLSLYTGYAQRLRTYLCGGQLLLAICCTLFEYALHQAHQKWPLWNGFRSLLACSRLVNIFVSYLISLVSALVILWLVFYESFGICRILVLVTHVLFVIYPETCRGLTWIRSQFFLKRLLSSLMSPTQEQLAKNADECPICYRVMTSNNSKVTNCGHVYHQGCLSTWMRRRPFCPMCNTDLFSTPSKRSKEEEDARTPD